MVKHTQTIRRLLPTNCLSVFDHFGGLALKGLKQIFFFSQSFLQYPKWLYYQITIRFSNSFCGIAKWFSCPTVYFKQTFVRRLEIKCTVKSTITQTAYLFQVNNGNTKTKCEICSKLTIKSTERQITSFWYLY